MTKRIYWNSFAGYLGTERKDYIDIEDDTATDIEISEMVEDAVWESFSLNWDIENNVVKWYFSCGYVGCDREDEFEVDGDETEEEIRETVLDEIYNYVDWGWDFKER